MCVEAETVWLGRRIQLGLVPNMIEVTGENAAVCNAIGNSMANSWGLLVPLLSVYCKRRFDSYALVFIQSAVVNVVGALLFFRYARLYSLAELEEREVAGKEVGSSVTPMPRGK